MPKTKLGKWACVLLIVFLVSLIALIIFLNVLGFKRGSVELVVPGIFMTISGLAAFVTGAISLFMFKDRSLLVIIATIFGFLAFLRFVMELV